MRVFSSMPFLALPVVAVLAGDVRAAAVDDANAAVAAARNGKYDDAIALFTNAINSDELNLKGRAQAYAYRGIAKATTGDYGGAQEDLNYAVVLDSDYNADAYAFRGYFRMVRGQPKEGAADLEKSAELLVWPYNALWLYLARLKSGTPDEGAHSLPANAAILASQIGADGTSGMMRWPAPVVRYMMDEMSEAEMRAAADMGDPARRAERICDADFYPAERDLARGDAAKARPKLQAAAEKCPFASFERMGAAAELDRMK
jgi:lipoprotein NlpI